MTSHYRRASLLFVLILVAILFFQGWKSVSVLQDKARAQLSVTEGVHQWKQSYLALREVLGKWEKAYRRDDSVQDLVSLYAMIGLSDYGLQTDADSVILNSVEPIVQNNIAIGLTKICLISTKGADRESLMVQAADYESLFRGLSKLADQPDIHIGTISIKGDSASAVASLGHFCVLLRTSQA